MKPRQRLDPGGLVLRFDSWAWLYAVSGQLLSVRRRGVPRRAARSLRGLPLHAAPQVQRLLDEGRQPHAYWSCGRPIVLPSGPLAPVVDDGVFGHAFDDPRLSEVDDRVTCLVGEFADLTRGR